MPDSSRPEQNKKMLDPLRHWVVIALCLGVFDYIAVVSAYALALFLRFDFIFSHIPKRYLSFYSHTVFIYAALCIPVFIFFRLYRSIWRFASYNELFAVLKANFVTIAAYTVYSLIVFRMPVSYYLFGGIVQLILTATIRFSYRIFLLLSKKWKSTTSRNRVLLIGAGSAGQLILRDMISEGADSKDEVCAIIDDNPNKWNRYIYNIKIVGGRESIFTAVKQYKIDKIFMAIPSASAEDRREILNICNETGCELKVLPGVYQFLSGEVTVSSLKEVAIEDLLGREPIRIRMEEVYEDLHGKVVLVTGGGGSIGSEICRQVAEHDPKQLIIFDVYENNAYEIQLELRENYPQLNLVTLIGSVRDSRRMDQVFRTYHPDIVYHAAAHKHVPLMEDSPCESIKNNAVGTYKTAYAAMKYGCKRFVLISTDKAVNPTNIMGASKRLCEMVVQSFASKIAAGDISSIPLLSSHEEDLVYSEVGTEDEKYQYSLFPAVTQFVAVRFGNVLGSNGSVVPIFKKQIAKGGPVTVTHPDIIRYFMTVPEAVSLVLQAGTYAQRGEIFVLDMGAPVKIDTLARNLIRLSGLKPDVDIKIEYTGLRPGEKLYEEKLMAEEGLQKTANERIHIGKPIPFDVDEFFAAFHTLMEVANNNREDKIREVVSSLVPTYHYK